MICISDRVCVNPLGFPNPTSLEIMRLSKICKFVHFCKMTELINYSILFIYLYSISWVQLFLVPVEYLWPCVALRWRFGDCLAAYRFLGTDGLPLTQGRWQSHCPHLGPLLWPSSPSSQMTAYVLLRYCRAWTDLLMQTGIEDYANMSDCALEWGNRAGSWELQPQLLSQHDPQSYNSHLEHGTWLFYRLPYLFLLTCIHFGKDLPMVLSPCWTILQGSFPLVFLEGRYSGVLKPIAAGHSAQQWLLSCAAAVENPEW